MALRPTTGTHTCQVINPKGLTYLDFCLCVVMFWLLRCVRAVALCLRLLTLVFDSLHVLGPFKFNTHPEPCMGTNSGLGLATKSVILVLKLWFAYVASVASTEVSSTVN